MRLLKDGDHLVQVLQVVGGSGEGKVAQDHRLLGFGHRGDLYFYHDFFFDLDDDRLLDDLGILWHLDGFLDDDLDGLLDDNRLLDNLDSTARLLP